MFQETMKVFAGGILMCFGVFMAYDAGRDFFYFRRRFHLHPLWTDAFLMLVGGVLAISGFIFLMYSFE